LRKIVYIVLITVVLSGCSVLRKHERRTGSNETNGRSVLLEELVRNNLTAGDFTISKMDVYINAGNLREKFSATLKFQFPDKYLVSIRSIGNIEVARFFLTPDTVLVNDRINRVVYYGDPEKFSRKFGLDYNLLPVIFGDYVNDNRSVGSKTNCINGSADADGFIRGMKLLYRIDCKNSKISAAEQEGNTGIVLNEINYSEFITVNDITIPSLINMHNKKSDNSLEIRISKIDRSIDAPVEFVPGNRYKKIELK
jgi:hypothetical protein